MLLREIKNIYHSELDGIYPPEEVDAIFNRIISHYLGLEGFVLALQPNLVLSKEEEDPVFEALAKLQQEIPLQYVTGMTYFLDLPMEVNASVLIPRPETEELVRWVLADGEIQKTHGKLLDIGTGSGNMAIAIKKNAPALSVFGLDVSPEALEVARRNAERNQVDISWIRHDIFENTPLEKMFDVVISNPPYVRESEKAKMQKNVVSYEPASALFVPDSDPMRYYQAILSFCELHLRPQGRIYFEINEALGENMIQLLSEFGYSDIQLKKDIFDKDRMIRAVAPT